MKVETSTLSGAALDFAAFVAEGRSYWLRSNAQWDHHMGCTDWILDTDKVLRRFRFDESCSRAGAWVELETFQPSLDWSQAGPIIEVVGIDISVVQGKEWRAQCYTSVQGTAYGPGPLVAAMRAFVASKFGSVVELPDQFLI